MKSQRPINSASTSIAFDRGLTRRSLLGAALVAAGLGGLAASAPVRAFAAPDPSSSDVADASGSADAAGAAGAADEAAFPITMKHALGETVIESKPERIATIGWGNQDALLALGVVPVISEAAYYGLPEGETSFSWTKEVAAELGVEELLQYDPTDGIDFEAISDAEPDLIIATSSGITAEDYEALTKIAPTVAYPTGPYITLWRENLLMESEAIGLKAEGEELLAKTEELIAGEVEKYPEIAGKKGAFLWVGAADTSVIYAYLPADPRASLLMDFGLEFPESVAELAGDTPDFSIAISSEMVDMLDDVEIAVLYGDDALLEQIQADPMLSKVPAFADGAVVMLESTSELAGASTPTVLSITATVEEYVGLIAEAARKVSA